VCARPSVGNFAAYNYLTTYSYTNFLGNVQKVMSGFNDAALQNATHSIIAPRGTPAPESEELSFGVCGQTAAKYFIN
jgi:hypothetical protein